MKMMFRKGGRRISKEARERMILERIMIERELKLEEILK